MAQRCVFKRVEAEDAAAVRAARVSALQCVLRGRVSNSRERPLYGGEDDDVITMMITALSRDWTTVLARSRRNRGGHTQKPTRTVSRQKTHNMAPLHHARLILVIHLFGHYSHFCAPARKLDDAMMN